MLTESEAWAVLAEIYETEPNDRPPHMFGPFTIPSGIFHLCRTMKLIDENMFGKMALKVRKITGGKNIFPLYRKHDQDRANWCWGQV